MNIRSEHWEHIDMRFKTLQNDVDLDNYLAPANRAAELQRFKEEVNAGRIYNPQFEYDPLPEIFETELRDLKAELSPNDKVDALFIEAIDHRLGEIRACQTHDAADVGPLSIQIYGRPDHTVIAAADKNIRDLKPDQEAYNGSKSGRIYDAHELAELCREAMHRYGFDWKVVVKEEMGAKAAVDNLIREFWIREDVRFHESLVNMMIVHEIGTHVLRSENGYAQPLKIFGRGMPAYQFTEEGLAEYAEEMTGNLMDDTVYRISGRVIGVDTAIRSSFWDVYETVRPYFDLEMSFDIAQRAKLGIADTSQPGAYTKDYSYLAGLMAVRKFFKTAQPRQIDAIFAGKVGFRHMDTVMALQDAGYLVKPPALPEWM